MSTKRPRSMTLKNPVSEVSALCRNPGCLSAFKFSRAIPSFRSKTLLQNFCSCCVRSDLNGHPIVLTVETRLKATATNLQDFGSLNEEVSWHSYPGSSPIKLF